MDKFAIKKIETAKGKIYRRQLMEKNIIPSHANVVIFNASQGSGKTNLAANLLMNPLYYGKSTDNKDGVYKPYFDSIFLFIGSKDDMYDHLIEEDIIKENHVCEMPTPQDIGSLINYQLAIVEEKGIENAPKILAICDDLINDKVLMNSKELATLFIKGRHLGISVWLMSQYLNRVPKALRLQANYIFIFKPMRVEVELLYEQYCPPHMNKKMFYQMVKFCTEPDEKSKFNFMVIVKRAPTSEMFRKNIIEFVHLSDDEPDKVKLEKTKKRSLKEKKKDDVNMAFEAESISNRGGFTTKAGLEQAKELGKKAAAKLEKYAPSKTFSIEPSKNEERKITKLSNCRLHF